MVLNALHFWVVCVWMHASQTFVNTIFCKQLGQILSDLQFDALGVTDELIRL